MPRKKLPKLNKLIPKRVAHPRNSSFLSDTSERSDLSNPSLKKTIIIYLKIFDHKTQLFTTFVVKLKSNIIKPTIIIL